MSALFQNREGEAPAEPRIRTGFASQGRARLPPNREFSNGLRLLREGEAPAEPSFSNDPRLGRSLARLALPVNPKVHRKTRLRRLALPDSAQLLAELLDAVDALVDLFHAGGEGEADVGIEAAVVAGDDGDVILFH